MGQEIGSLITPFKGRQPHPLKLPELTPPPVFVSLAMFCLEEIRIQHRTIKTDVLGGAGLWATFGARLFKPGEVSTNVGCIIVARNDVPRSLYKTLESWDMTLITREEKERGCTRALLDYADGKNFSYTNEPIYPTILHLDETELLRAKSFHLLGLPNEVRRNIVRLTRLRRARGLQLERPMILWEPDAAGCELDNLEIHFQIMEYVDVFSPTHDELSHLLDGEEPRHPFSHRHIEAQARVFVETGIGPSRNGLIVVRCGERGCFYMKNEREKGWIGTYWHPTRPEIKDVTGAGSAFLGAFMVAFVETSDPKYSCFRGTVAASFALEQYGLPMRVKRRKPKKNPFHLPFCSEMWNDDNAFWRLGQVEVEPRLFEQRFYPI